MTTSRRLVPALALCLGLVGCGSNNRASESAPAATPASAPAASASPGATVDASYFHDQLVVNGENIESDFGGALLTLGLNPRDLQQDTPDHAYSTTFQKVQALQDEKLRADVSRALFGHVIAR